MTPPDRTDEPTKPRAVLDAAFGASSPTSIDSLDATPLLHLFVALSAAEVPQAAPTVMRGASSGSHAGCWSWIEG